MVCLAGFDILSNMKNKIDGILPLVGGLIVLEVSFFDGALAIEVAIGLFVALSLYFFIKG